MERRRAARRTPGPGEPISLVRLRTGREMQVLDVSNWGVLVEGAARLLPGTHVDVHVVTPHGRVLVRSRIARCFVCLIEADALRYRGALAFERQVETSGYFVPAAGHDAVAAAGLVYPSGAPARTAAAEEHLPA